MSGCFVLRCRSRSFLSAKAHPQSLTVHLNGLVCRLACRLALGKLISSKIRQDIMGEHVYDLLEFVLFRKAVVARGAAKTTRRRFITLAVIAKRRCFSSEAERCDACFGRRG
jgi:hypothetical protein